MNSKKTRKLKVFHGLVNYGTQAGLFAQELRNQGVDALSVSYPDKYARQIDVELLHGGSFLKKVIKHTWNYLRKFYWFFKFNTFHFYFGTTLLPQQRDLPFYSLFGKKVIMEYLGYDLQLYQYSLDKYETTNVRYYKPHHVSVQADIQKIARLKSESRYINKQLVCAPYLSEFAPGAPVLPLAIDISDYSFTPKAESGSEIVVMHAPTSRDNKGTTYILEAIDKLILEGYSIRKLLTENITHSELKKKYLECDIFIDQILGGWYGTATIEAMALGRPTICFIRESYYEHINYGNKIPIINAKPSTIYEVLKKTIDEKHLLPKIGSDSRKFVEEIHDIKKITSDLITIYKNL